MAQWLELSPPCKPLIRRHLLLVLALLRSQFLPGSPVFLSLQLQKPTLLNSNSIRKVRVKSLSVGCATTVKFLLIVILF